MVGLHFFSLLLTYDPLSNEMGTEVMWINTYCMVLASTIEEARVTDAWQFFNIVRNPNITVSNIKRDLDSHLTSIPGFLPAT